jgi:hypothetical protein
MEATVEDKNATVLDGLVAQVEEARSSGLSVAAACRSVGVSTSTYYRRRRTGPGKALAQVAEPSPPDWPFPLSTPRAPHFWDQAFQNELSDSFVRREFGAGALKGRPCGRALSAVASTGRFSNLQGRTHRLYQRLSAGPLGAAGPTLLALAAMAALGLAAGWMVSVAADPAAWLSEPARIASY